MEAVQKQKNGQTKKKTKKSKFRNSDGKVQECSYEKLPQEVESLQVSDSEEASYSRPEGVANLECVLSEAFGGVCEESLRLLESEGKEHLEVRPEEVTPSWHNTDNMVNSSEVKNYIQFSEIGRGRLSSETELNEFQPSATLLLEDSNQADTNFESPLHLPTSSSLESAEDSLSLWIEQSEETEIANEAVPSAPIGQVVYGSSVDSAVSEITPENVLSEKPYFPFDSEEEEIEPRMKPFTLSQLAALYHNPELEAGETFVAQFVESELRGGDVLRHPLYELLTSYQRARAKLTVNNKELITLKQECWDHQSLLWSLNKCVVTEQGECQDGNPVEASHEFQTAHYNKSSASNLSRCLCSIRELITESFALNAYTCEVIKLQVDDYIQNLLSEFSFLPHNAPVSLVCEMVPLVDARTGQDLREELRRAISVLFTFQRRPLRDDGFVADTRTWLGRVVAVLLRVATWQDHLFLLHHALRCPAGVSKWATSFIQPPSLPFNSPFSNQHLDHLVVCLASILLPVQARDMFLSQMMVSDESEAEAAWVLVDSDGEDETDTNGLRESDIVAFLNQVPFDAIFRQVLHITQQDDQNMYNTQMLTDANMLRLIAFCSLVLGLLEQGLSNHGAIRYRQYCKRLGRLVRHTMQYTTDQLQLFRSECVGGDAAMVERLAVEYDALLSRAVSVLYRSPGRTTWQFLAVLPFGSISTSQLWKLFRFLLLGDDEPVDESTWNMRLEEQLGGLSDAEVYYLLTAVNTMALSRPLDDWPFIRATVLQLLEIGFLNPTTRDSCFKSARIMLVNLTLRYTALISVILDRLNTSANCGKLCLYLVKDLPLSLWRPGDVDLSILEQWLLLYGITSVRHALARHIISSLNLGYATDDLSHELFLSRDVHVRIAMMVLKTSAQYCSQQVLEGNIISDTVKQVATLAQIVRPTSSEQACTLWVWQTAYKLRIHLLDRSDAEVRNTLANPMTGLSVVPDMDAASEVVELVTKQIKTNQEMAVYMGLQLTALGHNVPLICRRGFSLLSTLQSCGLETAAISMLQHLVPLFLDCPSTLVESDKFRSIVLSLLSADKTFLKAAKSLITSDFPGQILQQFGDMIQYHLDNYSRYNLMSSTPLAQLWLQSLCIVWNEEPTSASYLMDVVLSCAFFRPDITAMAYHNLGQLLQWTESEPRPETLISTTQANSRLSSFFSWISGNAIVSLVPQGGSCPHAPWFAYFALHVEELHTQGTNGLWREVIKELALTNGKPSVDNAIKRAATTLKLTTIPASALSIYRWSQQALDTSVDHPVLPLLWQRFFILYFTRVVTPTGEDLGSVGYKLFEGMMYQTYHKRLKRKLSDCVEYFRTKATAAAEGTSPDKHLLYDTLAKLYETFSLWLDEPRLHEPLLYLPALPPQYNPYKLSIITSGTEQNPWYEYVDYERVRATQNTSMERWQKTLGRVASSQMPPPQSQEDPDPVQRINKRLSSYDSPVPPPPLKPCHPVIPPITRDCLLNKEAMLEALKPSFKNLLEYAQSFCLRVSEHTALDCSMLELLPILYSHTETEITLHAACDTADPRGRPPASHTLNCAGPAVIYIKVSPACINEGVKHQIETNREEMDGLLKRSLQAPPSAMCIASIHIEHATRTLERECSELKDIGDVQLLTPQRQVGIALFYHMSTLCADDIMSYSPLKQRLTSCIETLGNMFISGEESQCVRLLATVLQNPNLSGLMGPHFTPSVASPGVFLQLYCTLVESDQTSPDLRFVLLTKFDLGLWLNDRKPRLVERSQIIELAGKALASAGLSPPQEILMLHGVFRHHLATLFMFDFPQHYGEVLSLTLRHSETQALAPDTWYDLVNALAGARCRPGLSLAQVKEVINKYATEQRALSVQELRDTASMFGGHFTKERLQYGLYGLYPKYRVYIEPLSTFQGMIGHALVVATLQNDRGSLSDKLCEQLWPHLCGMFSPWLAPYFTRHLTEPTAAWIQQLTDDRSVLPPWIVADGGHANKMASMFVECIRFVVDTLPVASSNMLSCVWQFYVTNFAHNSIKDYILSVMHGNLISLPWQRFFPTLQDIDLMLKVVDQYLPDCHTFLGAVFIEVPWYTWVAHTATQESSRAHASLLHLLIKLANEPNVRQSSKITPLLVESQQFAWHLVDCNSYESVTNWFVMSYDPRVILQLTGEDWSNIDMAALDLLEMAAGYSTKVTQFHPSTLRKRQMFVRACVKLVLSCLSRHKQLVTTRQDEIRAAVRRMVDKVETVVTHSVPGPQKVSEAGLLLTEILALVNQASNSPVATLAVEALLGWLSSRSTTSVVVSALLRVLGITVASCSTLGALLEASLSAFFRPSDLSDSSSLSWSLAVYTLQPIVPRHPPLEDSLVTSGQLLSLYALTLKHMPVSLDVRQEAILLNNLNQWLSVLKVTDSVESKLPLLWSQVLYLCMRQCEYSSDPETGSLTLRQLVQSITQGLEHRAGAGWGILGAIGIVKSQSASYKCRLLSRFVVALSLAQMPDSRNNAGTVEGDHTVQFVRIKPHAPGSITASNGDYVPSHEAMKALSTLDALAADKSYADVRTIAECAARLVRQPENSLHNAHQLVMDIARQLYSETYLHAHRVTDNPSA